MKHIYLRSLLTHVIYALCVSVGGFFYAYLLSGSLSIALLATLPGILFLLYRYIVMFRGGFMLAANQSERALRYLTGVLRIFPGSMSALSQLAQAKSLLKDYDGVLEDCSDGIQTVRRKRFILDKNRRSLLVSFYATRLSAHMANNDNGGLLSDGNMLKKLRPNIELGYNACAIAYMNMDDLEGALDEIEMALPLSRMATGKAQVLSAKGLIHFAQGNFELAKQTYQQALSIPVERDVQVAIYPTLYRQQAMVAFVEHDAATAHNLLQKGLVIAPEDVSLNLAMAIMQYHTGHKAEAYTLWRTLQAKEPKMMDAEWVCATYYKRISEMGDVARQIIADLNPPAVAPSPENPA